MEYSNFSFANLIFLIPRFIIYFNFLILMTGRASYLTLKLVLHHDELKNVNHVVLRGALVDTQPCMCIISWDAGGRGNPPHPPNLY